MTYSIYLFSIFIYSQMQIPSAVTYIHFSKFNIPQTGNQRQRELGQEHEKSTAVFWSVDFIQLWFIFCLARWAVSQRLHREILHRFLRHEWSRELLYSECRDLMGWSWGIFLLQHSRLFQRTKYFPKGLISRMESWLTVNAWFLSIEEFKNSLTCIAVEFSECDKSIIVLGMHDLAVLVPFARDTLLNTTMEK